MGKVHVVMVYGTKTKEQIQPWCTIGVFDNFEDANKHSEFYQKLSEEYNNKGGCTLVYCFETDINKLQAIDLY